MTLPANPLAKLSLRDFAALLRRGETSAEAVTLAYLERVRALDAKLGAFRVVTADAAIKAARGIDSLLSAGTDLGPLMGVPVAVKEIFATGLTPAGAGSDMDIRFLGLSEGPFIRALKRAGCIILGITRTTEFAASTVNVDKPMPWNPADLAIKRVADDVASFEAAAAWNIRAGHCTRPGNFYGLCGTTIPIQAEGELPIGLQVLAPAGHDPKLLAISQTIEAVVGSHTV